ncbi:rhodanese-like domain-containing protein [Nonomuraea sp. NBC_00507]|uniref:rhodanese-like domain-containing protein n=1 Tax=Nonomuraea sp. NBC_00507 TaxID=2976002 RepID=UPI003FA558C8
MSRFNAARIDAVSARSLIAADPGVLLVDVRTPAEFRSAHLDGAVNLPLEQIDAAHLRRIVASAGGPMVLICQSGNRAERARQALAGAGSTDVARSV